MKIYNTLTRTIEEIVPAGEYLTMYSCGPTVYDAQTIGNYTAYLRWDLLARVLQDEGYKLKWIMNLTDVGHLVSDEDSGEDKLEKGARREGLTAWQVADKYIELFKKDIQLLNINFPIKNFVRATDNIPQQIELIQQLEKKGFTYATTDGVYFDSSKFTKYSDFARLNTKGQQAGARVDIGEKKSSTDFALWKFTPSGAKRDMQWDSPWGVGFPGWHIECSAMAMKFLGNTVDIHTGGIDHIPVHHTNEIAQSESATGKQFVRYWVHNNFLKIDGDKIAKSLGNGYTLSDVAEKGFSALDFKMMLLQSHYQSEANFTWDILSAAQKRRIELKQLASLKFQAKKEIPDQKGLIHETKQSIQSALADNLNSPKALSSLSHLMEELLSEGLSQSSIGEFKNLLIWLDSIFGLSLDSVEDITDAQKDIIMERQNARENSEWQKSDELRVNLEKDKILIKDTANGPIWMRLY